MCSQYAPKFTFSPSFQIFSIKNGKSGASIQHHVLPCYKLESGPADEKLEGDPTHLHDGIGVDLDNGSIVIECAHLEWHATTRVDHPDETNPSRLSLVFYQHNNLKLQDHGRRDP